MERKYVIGLDFGSDSVRALIVDSSDGTEISSGVAAYSRWSKGMYCSPDENRYRQHPLDYIEATESCIRTALSHCGKYVADNIAGIGYDTTASTPVLVDEKGIALALYDEYKENPNAMFVLWKDHTALKEAEEITAAAISSGTDYTKYCGGSYSCEWAWAKMLHCLRTDTTIRGKAYSWVEHCDWIGGILTGNSKPEKIARGRCTAGHKAMWNAEWDGLPPIEFFTEIDSLYELFKGHLYNETVTAGTQIGTLTKEWAERLGLEEGIPVSMGAIDCHAGSVGVGIDDGALVKVMGTSTCDIAVSSDPQANKRLVNGICGQVDGSVLPGYIGYEAGQAAFGDIYAWFKRLLEWPLSLLPEDIKAETSSKILKELNVEAAEIELTENDPIALDWHNGRRTPDLNPYVKGAVNGLTLSTSAPQLFKALVEATAFGSRAITERLAEEGVNINQIIAVGGISKKSPYVMQVLADVLGAAVKTVVSEQACALGSAIFAACGAGLYQNISAAQKTMASQHSDVYYPDTIRHEIYNSLYERYKVLGREIEGNII